MEAVSRKAAGAHPPTRPPVPGLGRAARHQAGRRDGGRAAPGGCKVHGEGGGLVAFVPLLSDSAASVMRSTSHVKAVKFSGWEPHGVHQAS